MFIDALQYVRPSEEIFRQMRDGNLSAVHITVGYHEDFDGVLENLQMWNGHFERHPDLIFRATGVDDIHHAKATGKTAIFFGLQNPLPIGADLRRIELLSQMGIKFCQLTYNQQSLLGAGCFEPNDSGLTAFGAEVIHEMNRVGMVIDLSHAGAQTALDAVAVSDRPITVTHANPKDWHDVPRNLHHDLLQALSDKGGMVGFSLYPHHLQTGSDCTMANFAKMVRHSMEKYGDQMFGIGSDLCQGQPDSVVNWMRNGHWRKIPNPPVQFPDCPTWFGNNSQFPGIATGLTENGLSQDQVDGVMGQNWLNFLTQAFVPK